MLAARHDDDDAVFADYVIYRFIFNSTQPTLVIINFRFLIGLYGLIIIIIIIIYSLVLFTH